VTTKPQARSSISRQVCSGELVGLWPAIGSPPRDTQDKEAMKILSGSERTQPIEKARFWKGKESKKEDFQRFTGVSQPS
jgi:hypothetical protein